MSDFWSGWVIVLILFNLGLALFLFLWGLRVEIPTQPDGTSGHVWAHGVLREGVRNLPFWWVVMSVAAFAAGIGYLVLYPGFGSFPGYLNWTSQDQLARNQATNRERVKPLKERIRDKSLAAIAADGEALRTGEVIFVDNCAGCHGRNAKGNLMLGAPDLTDDDWLYGGDDKAIVASIADGRRGVMPPFAAALPGDSLLDLAHYVASLSNGPYDSIRASSGRHLFTNCVPCHGAEGKGNPALGAPNLTDSIQLYPSRVPSQLAVTIGGGRNGVMPAWRERLGADNVTLVAAWVYAQSHPTAITASR